MTILRTPRLQAWLLTLLCVTLLLGRAGVAHLHLCFDGKESPSSFHVFDIGLHHAGSGIDAPHDDLDVAVSGERLFTGKFQWNAPLVLLAAIVLCGFRRVRRRLVVPPLVRTVHATPPFLWPPLRGPPLPASR